MTKSTWKIFWILLAVSFLVYLTQTIIKKDAFTIKRVVQVDTVPVFLIDTVPLEVKYVTSPELRCPVVDERCPMVLQLFLEDTAPTFNITHVNFDGDMEDLRPYSQFTYNGRFSTKSGNIEAFVTCDGKVVRFSKPFPKGEVRSLLVN